MKQLVIILAVILFAVYQLFIKDNAEEKNQSKLISEPIHQKIEQVKQKQKTNETQVQPKQKIVKEVKPKPKKVANKFAIKSVKLFSGSLKGDATGSLKNSKYSYPTKLLNMDDTIYVVDEVNTKIKMIDHNKVNSIMFYEKSKFSKKKKEIKIRKISSVAVDNSFIYAIDYWGNNIFKFEKDGRFSARIQGKGQFKLNSAESIAIDNNGKVYITDTNKHKIRYIQNNKINTYAGKDKYGQLDGGLNTATFNKPRKIVFDVDNSMYILDGTGVIRVIKNKRVSTLTDIKINVSTFAIINQNIFVYSNQTKKLYMYNIKTKKMLKLGKNIGAITGKVHDMCGYDKYLILSNSESNKLYKVTFTKKP